MEKLSLGSNYLNINPLKKHGKTEYSLDYDLISFLHD